MGKLTFKQKQEVYQRNSRRKNTLLQRMLPDYILYNDVVYSKRWVKHSEFASLEYVDDDDEVFVYGQGDNMKDARAECVAHMEMLRSEGYKFVRKFQPWRPQSAISHTLTGESEKRVR